MSRGLSLPRSRLLGRSGHIGHPRVVVDLVARLLVCHRSLTPPCRTHAQHVGIGLIRLSDGSGPEPADLGWRDAQAGRCLGDEGGHAFACRRPQPPLVGELVTAVLPPGQELSVHHLHPTRSGLGMPT